MVEIELSAFSKQCLERHIGNIEALAREAYAWEQRRNQIQANVHWRFTKIMLVKSFEDIIRYAKLTLQS